VRERGKSLKDMLKERVREGERERERRERESDASGTAHCPVSPT